MTSAPLSRPVRSITRTRSTPIALPVTSRFTARERGRCSSLDKSPDHGSEEFGAAEADSNDIRIRSMKVTTNSLLRTASGIVLGLMLIGGGAQAQAPSSSPTPTNPPDQPNDQTVGDQAGDYLVISSFEFGYRG